MSMQPPTREEVQAAIETLPALERELLFTLRGDGLSFAETAARHGISVRRVETLVARALGRIRRRIARNRKRRR